MHSLAALAADVNENKPLSPRLHFTLHHSVKDFSWMISLGD
jgi:hypothetical protein